jgi:threonine dehydrogenase-like Zn-dependent dehydrogenase
VRSIASGDAVAGLDVVVIGTGIAGLGLVAYSRMTGARSVTCIGRRPERLERASACGADHVFTVGEAALDDLIAEVTGGGASRVFEASGDAEMILRGARWCRPGGALTGYGVTSTTVVMDWRQVPKDVTLLFPSTREAEVYPEVLAALDNGQIDSAKLITHRFDLDDLDDAFRAVDAGEVIKALIRCS